MHKQSTKVSLGSIPTFPVKSEAEIMQKWRDSASPMVSICCATYNHVRYIETAIKSFLMQETNFSFEVIIRDDCSTDGTSDLVMAYQQRYPNIIKACINQENQFGKGVRASQVWPTIAKGRYIALCEGDDFWLSTQKLQKQVDLLEANQNINLCFHSSATLENGRLYDTKYRYESRIYSLEEHILADFHFIQTNTLMLRKSIYDQQLIQFLSNITIGDFFLRFYFGTQGGICINEQMGCYRVLSQGSWSSRLKNAADQKKFFVNYMQDLARFDTLLKTRYDQLITNYMKKVLSAAACSNMQYIDKLSLLKCYFDKVNLTYALKYCVFSSINFNLLRYLRCLLKRS